MKYMKMMCAGILMTCTLAGCIDDDFGAPDFTKAVGMIIVNDTQPLTSGEKIYASFSNYQYSFALDAAVVYAFDADKDAAYAGEQALSELTLAAMVDNGYYGADGAAAYQLSADGENTVTGYYLYRDEEGLYFTVENPFIQADIDEEPVIEGTEFMGTLVMKAEVPGDHVQIVQYDENHRAVKEEVRKTAEINENVLYEAESEAATVEVTVFDENNQVIDAKVLEPYENKIVLCYSGNGQFLNTTVLRVRFDEKWMH